MVLLHALRALEAAGDYRVVGAAHLNHGVRGQEAEEDEALCSREADRLGLSFDCEHCDVGRLAAERGWSIEAAGHAARYDFFNRAAARLGADRIALGHTNDDQAETFLLRLLRGAGPRGLGGMYPRVGMVIRPMLDCSRRDVRAFASLHGIAFREDSTNGDLAIPRNLVRHQIIPSLTRVSPGIVRVLGRTAAIARDDAQLLDDMAAKTLARTVSGSDTEIRLDAAQLRGEPPAIARRVVALAMSRLSDGRFLAFQHAQRLLDLVHDPVGGVRQVCLPGQIATREGETVVLRRGDQTTGQAAVGTNFRFLLSIPGEVVSPAGWALCAERRTWPLEERSGFGSSQEMSPGNVFCAEGGRVDGAAPEDRPADGACCATMDAAGIAAPLIVRNWAPGDRVRPLGMTGTRKLQDLFVDRKVPRADRLRVPVVADTSGRILWVAGHVIAEEFRVTPATSDVVILKLKYWRNGT